VRTALMQHTPHTHHAHAWVHTLARHTLTTTCAHAHGRARAGHPNSSLPCFTENYCSSISFRPPPKGPKRHKEPSNKVEVAVEPPKRPSGEWEGQGACGWPASRPCTLLGNVWCCGLCGAPSLLLGFALSGGGGGA